MPNYSAMIKELEGEVAILANDREKLCDRIDTLLNTIESIKRLAEGKEEQVIQPTYIGDGGFTDRIRSLLELNAAKSFSPKEIREIFAEFDKDADPKVMLIHIHNTVKRLHKQGELEELTRPDGKAYRWQSVMAKERMEQIKQHASAYFRK